jgi:hypothetical protein
LGKIFGSVISVSLFAFVRGLAGPKHCAAAPVALDYLRIEHIVQSSSDAAAFRIARKQLKQYLCLRQELLQL